MFLPTAATTQMSTTLVNLECSFVLLTILAIFTYYIGHPQSVVAQRDLRWLARHTLSLQAMIMVCV